MHYVYVLRSLKDGNKYIGVTKNIEKRLAQHNSGNTRSTKSRRPFRLEYYEIYKTKFEAIMTERKYKKSHDALLRSIRKNNLQNNLSKN